ncbi:unnamed protein product [Merluccius merluccius]
MMNLQRIHGDREDNLLKLREVGDVEEEALNQAQSVMTRTPWRRGDDVKLCWRTAWRRLNSLEPLDESGDPRVDRRLGTPGWTGGWGPEAGDRRGTITELI